MKRKFPLSWKPEYECQFKKVRPEYTTHFYDTLNQEEAQAWKSLLIHIANASLIIKFKFTSELCAVITDYSIGTFVSCKNCSHVNFQIVFTNATKCQNCSKLLLQRWCDECKENYTISVNHYDDIYTCIVCETGLCPRNKCKIIQCKNKLLNVCQNRTECLCCDCKEFIILFNSYLCGPCEDCKEWLCGKCYSICTFCQICNYIPRYSD